jgi:hypothetical protein
MNLKRTFLSVFLVVIFFTGCDVFPFLSPKTDSAPPLDASKPLVSTMPGLVPTASGPLSHSGSVTISPKETYVGDCRGGEPTLITVQYKPDFGMDPEGKIIAIFTPFASYGKIYTVISYEMTWVASSSYWEVVADTRDWKEVTSAGGTEVRVEFEPIGSTTREKIYDTQDGYKAGMNLSVRTKVCSAPTRIDCPVGMEFTATSPLGVTDVLIAPGGLATCPPVTITCSPPSGSSFAVGTSPVTCKMSNSCGSVSSCSFNVIVKPYVPIPITITCPSNLTVSGTSSAGAKVTYSAPGVSGGCKTPAVVCTPPSGSAFPVGLLTVACTATDGCGSSAACNFNVKVNPYIAPTNKPAPTKTSVPTNPPPPSCQDYDEQTCPQHANEGCAWLPKPDQSGSSCQHP